MRSNPGGTSPTRPNRRTSSHPPIPMRTRGQIRCALKSQMSRVCSRKITPRPMSIKAPTGSFADVNRSPPPKVVHQSKRIGGACPVCIARARAHRIDNLIEVEDRDGQPESVCHGQRFRSLAPSDEQEDEDHQVGQSFSVLAGVDRAHAEREEAGQNACQSRIRAGGHSSAQPRGAPRNRRPAAPRSAARLPVALPGSSRNKSLHAPNGCSWHTAVFRTCGKMPPSQHRDG